MTSQSPNVGIIGGGMMGISLAYQLTQANYDVTIYERGHNLGGLAANFEYKNTKLDRFYHTILSSDLSMQNLIKATGIENQLHFVETKQGFYDSGQIYPFNTPIDLMSYPPLSFLQRFRLGLQVIYAQFQNDWREIDKVPVDDWLIKVSGQAVYDKVWKPLLRAKFDTTADSVPATYIWSRLKRMTSTRQGVTSKEMMCYLEGSYSSLVTALEQKLKDFGVTMLVDTAISEICIDDGKATGLKLADGSIRKHDIIVSTLPSPVLAGLLPDAPPLLVDKLAKQQYLGVLCPLLILKKRLTPYYVLNITDDSIPFTAVVETTNLIDPIHVNNMHLAYLPKYLAPDNDMINWSPEKVEEVWMEHFKVMFPDYDTNNIESFIVQKARYVEPIRPMGTLDDIPTIRSSISGLYIGNTTMIYPDLGNGEAVTRFSEQIFDAITTDTK